MPEADIRRRFSRSIVNFWDTYRQEATEWHLFYNSAEEFLQVAFGDRASLEVLDEALFSVFLERLRAAREG